MKKLPKKAKVQGRTQVWHSRIPWKWNNIMSNISKLTNFGQVEIQRRV